METKPLRLETDRGLVDSSEHASVTAQLKSAAEDAAAAVGEFASKITHDAQAGAFKAKELMEHGAAKAKETVEDLLGLEETPEDEGIAEENIGIGGYAPRDYSIDQPETPIILPPARPPTPPKPREHDAPATPPVLDLGGPAHPHQFSPYQRKPSLKITPTTLGVTTTGYIPLGSTVGGAKGPSWLDIRRWDKNGKYSFFLQMRAVGRKC